MTSLRIVCLSSLLLVGCAARVDTTADDATAPTSEAADSATASCAPFDARAVGACRGLAAVVWDGRACVQAWGCRCEGRDCVRATEARCAAVAARCGARDAGVPRIDSAAPDAAPDAPKTVSCDTRKIACRMVTPTCPAGQVPSVVDSCYGECVPIERCGCSGPNGGAECPEGTTCWGHLFACGPYTR
jgi:hypothetical protein